MSNLSLSELSAAFASEQLFGLALASIVLCLFGFLFQAFAKHQSAATRFWIWELVGCGILLSFAALCSVSGIPLRTSLSVSSSESYAKSVETPSLAEIDSAIVNRSYLSTDRASDFQTLTSIDFDSLEPTEVPLAENSAALNDNSEQTDQSVAAANLSKNTTGNYLRTGLLALMLIWGTICVGNFLWFVSCVYCCYRVAWKATVAGSEKFEQALKSTIEKMNRSDIGTAGSQTIHGIDVLLSDNLASPFAIGIWQPKIVLPRSSNDWSASKLEMVLAHEFAHIQRNDVLWHWLNRLACCLVWFNPLIWIAAKRVAFERERACDDRVIRAGFAATDYGQSLIEIAATMSRRSMLTGSVSMAQPPLKQRLESILNPNANRRGSSFKYCTLAALVLFLLAGSFGVFRPLAIASTSATQDKDVLVSSNETSNLSGDGEAGVVQEPTQPAKSVDQTDKITPQEIDTFKMADSVMGSIENHDGEPVTGATVKLRIYRYVRQATTKASNTKVYGNWTVTTDAKGRFAMDTSKVADIPEDARLSIDRVYGPEIVEGQGLSWSAQEISALQEIPAYRLRRGREITGQILDSHQQPIQAIIRAAGRVLEINQSYFSGGVETDPDGNFRLLVPVDYQVELLAIAPGYIPQRILVPGNKVPEVDYGLSRIQTIAPNKPEDPANKASDENAPYDAGKVVLSDGCIVKGRLLGGNGEPAAGVVVAMRTCEDSCLLPNFSFGASFACLTDKEGQFEFPPATGQCFVFVAESAPQSNRLGSDLLSGKSPPPVDPIEFELANDSKTKELVLQEITETQIVSGTVRWDDGRPAAGLEIMGRRLNVEFDKAISDQYGNYQLKMPRPLKNACVSAWGMKDEGGVYHTAVAMRDGQISNGVLDTLDGDLTGIDWCLRPLHGYDESFARLRLEFSELEEKAQRLWKAYVEAEAKAETAEEKERIYLQMDPRNAMAKDYLAFEEKHRGQQGAFLAINAVTGSAQSVGNPETLAARGRVEMVDRLIKYYLEHPKLASIFENLSSGPNVPDRDRILELAIKHSPHRAVRGQAFLYQTHFALEDLRNADMLPIFREYALKIASADLPNHLRGIQQNIEALEAIDAGQLRSKAMSWLEVMGTEYGDIRVESEGRYYGQQLGSIAWRLRFALANLIVGKPVPEIQVTDVHGNNFRLSKHRGRPVVLTITFDHGIKSELDGQDLAKKYAEQDVEFLTVVGVLNQAKFLSKYPAEQLYGTVATEEIFSDGSIHNKWCENSTTIFLIDENGALQMRGCDEVYIEKWLKEKLN